MRVACVGAGPAGLYFAILQKLRAPRSEVTVYERSPSGVTHGWGVVFWQDLLDVLHQSDPASARDLAAQAFRWVDQVVELQGAPALRSRGTGFAIRRQRLLDVLSRRAEQLGVVLRYGQEIAEPAQLPDADVIVAADGAGSALRRSQAAHLRPRVLAGRNKYVWLGTTRCFESFTFGFTPTPAGLIWCHAYGFEPGLSTLIAECAPHTWEALGFDRLDGQASLQLLEQLFAPQLQGHRLLCATPVEGGLPWLRFRTVTNERWHAGRVVLMGDAAHTTHFAIGSGTRLAIQDAVALAGALGGTGDPQAAFLRYEAERREALRPAQEDARLSARWLEHVPRYSGLPPEQFCSLLLNRRSRVMPYLPPRLYCQLRRAKYSPPLRRLRGWGTRALQRARQGLERVAEALPGRA